MSAVRTVPATIVPNNVMDRFAVQTATATSALMNVTVMNAVRFAKERIVRLIV